MRTAITATTGVKPKRVELSAKVFPACQCGAAYPKHVCLETGCTKYTPRRPIEDLGVVAYTHRLWYCRLLEKIERWCRVKRQQFEKNNGGN